MSNSARRAGRAARGAPFSGRARVGLISDTHGLLRPEAVALLRGCDRIVHAGDVGGIQILDALRSLAPVTAVRGNNDTDAWARALHETEVLQVCGVRLVVVHELTKLDLDPRADAVRLVVHGHSHRPLIEERDGVLFVNPGSAGPRRFKLPITIGELSIEAGRVTPRILPLAPGLAAGYAAGSGG